MVSEKLEALRSTKSSKKKKKNITGSVDMTDPLFLPASLTGTPGNAAVVKEIDIVGPKAPKKKVMKKKKPGVNSLSGSSKVQSGTAPVVKKANKLRSTPVPAAPTATAKKPSK